MYAARRKDLGAHAAINAPDWVPPLVKRMAALTTGRGLMPFCGDLAQRLLMDPRMRTVWQTLRSRKATPAALTRWQRINHWKLSNEDDTAQDMAYGAFFSSALSAFGFSTLDPQIIDGRSIQVKMPLGVKTQLERKRRAVFGRPTRAP
jgi:hypothetical protein